MKHYIGTINNQLGEREIASTVRFKTDGEPWDYLETLAQRFWGAPDPDDEDDDSGPEEVDGYYVFGAGDVATTADGFKQVTLEVYDALDGIVTELTDQDSGW